MLKQPKKSSENSSTTTREAIHRVFCGQYPDCGCKAECARYSPVGGDFVDTVAEEVDMSELCSLCRKPPLKTNRLSTHHIQGRKKGVHMPVMRVHEGSCHRFADWITQLYEERGILADLKAEHVVYYFTRIASVRDEGVFILPIFAGG